MTARLAKWTPVQKRIQIMIATKHLNRDSEETLIAKAWLKWLERTR